MAHHSGCNAVSWQPAAVPGSLLTIKGGSGQAAVSPTGNPVNSNESAGMRLATGGCDNLVKIWRYAIYPSIYTFRLQHALIH